ncbi:MAG: FAD-dependent oxidoreductase [Crocinitomicaceae bacterium]
MIPNEKISYWEQKSFFNDVDYIIIGAGIVGYSTAISLKRLSQEAKILILERGNLPSGASSKNAGFACFGSATELYTDLQNGSEEEIWNTVKKRWNGLQNLRSLIGDENLKLETHGSWDLITQKESELFNATAKLLPHFNQKLKEITGEDNVYCIDTTIGNKFEFESIETSIYNRLEGQIDTAEMNNSFYKQVIKEGINVIFGTEVTAIQSTTDCATVTTHFGEITSKSVAICTNGFATQFIEDEEILPARAQVIITKPIPNLKIEGTFHYDAGYYYFRNIDNRILFGGGRNIDLTGETTTEISTSPEIINHLKSLLKSVILPTTNFEIDHQWAGIMGVGSSKKPIVKKCTHSIFCGVRLGGMGIAIGSLVGKELAELIIDDNKSE